MPICTEGFLDFVTDTGYFVGMFVAKFKQAGVSLERMAAIIGTAPAEALVERRELHLTGPHPKPEPVAAEGEPLRHLEVARIHTTQQVVLAAPALFIRLYMCSRHITHMAP